MLEDYSTDQSKSYKIQIECAQWFDSFAKLLKHSYELGYLILFFISPLLPPTLSFIYMMSYNVKDQHLMGEDNVKKNCLFIFISLFIFCFVYHDSKSNMKVWAEY